MIVVRLPGGIPSIGIQISRLLKKIGTIRLKRIKKVNSDITLFNSNFAGK
jgi:hypothetical protein